MSPDIEEHELENQKKVEFYAASVNAWFNSSLEHDKSLLTLSAGGIGLLLTLLTTVGPSSTLVLILYFIAIISFIVAVATILFIFKFNLVHIQRIFGEKSSNNEKILKKSDLCLQKLDFMALCVFGIGVLATASIAITVAVGLYLNKEITMANDSKNKTMAVPAYDSFAGVSRFEQRSFAGAGNLEPQSTAKSPTTAAKPAANPTQSGLSQNKTDKDN